MKNPFLYPTRGPGRAQVVLIGNGLEYAAGQPSWRDFLNTLPAPGVPPLVPGDPRLDIPFPLLYTLLSTEQPAPGTLSQAAVQAEEKRLAAALQELKAVKLPLMDRLTALGADHILTTNYSYCLERSFFPRRSFQTSKTRSALRLNLNPPGPDGKQPREVAYRLHTCTLGQNADGSPVGLWHIHGEVSVPYGVVVGHDRYSRLLSRMERLCDSQAYDGSPETPVRRAFTSWPELFLYGDVYILGFGFYPCEHDLWWLLRRKQRERYADGQVYYYDNAPEKDPLKAQLLAAHGVKLNPGVAPCPEYDTFYHKALDAIGEQIQKNR